LKIIDSLKLAQQNTFTQVIKPFLESLRDQFNASNILKHSILGADFDQNADEQLG